MRNHTRPPAAAAHNGITQALRTWTEKNPLRQYRRERGLTLSAIAGSIGVSVNTLRNWETGTSPSLDNFQRIEQLMSRQIRPAWKAWQNKRPRFQEQVA